MLGLCYIVLSIWLGVEIFEWLFGEKLEVQSSQENEIWLKLPAWFGIGILLMTWGTYLVSWIASVNGKITEPLYYGNFVMFLVAGVVSFFLWRRKDRKKMLLISNQKYFQQELCLFVLVAAVLTFFFFYVFHVKNGYLYSGFTVFSDYSPHLSMIRSFSKANNFPTQYPHFGGEDVKYHFMFQFLAGNLEYLGLRIDLAYNLISIFSLTGFLMLFYTLVQRIFHNFAAGALAIFFFFFRSSFSFFRFIWDHWQMGDLWQTLKENTGFIGYTMNESWGFWNLNVYLNQRHLAFGLLLITLALLVFWNWFEAGIQKEEKGSTWLLQLWFTGEAWKSRGLLQALGAGILLGLCAFWNGAAVIGGLLILGGMAFFSLGKLDYLLTAVLTILLSEFQSLFFMEGSSIGMRFQWGFLAESHTAGGVIKYLLMMSGLVFCGMLVVVWFQNRMERCLLCSFLLPLLFAFTVSMTPDIGVNHKYIMIAMHFTGALWAGFLGKLWKKSTFAQGFAVLLGILLSATGIYDSTIILRGNDEGHRLGVHLESDLTNWLVENTSSEDLILTPEYTMNESTFSGMMMYCGWPYYAWSAGYDTRYREDMAIRMYTTDSEEELRTIVSQENITYILFEEGSSIGQISCQEGTIASTYPLVYTSENGGVRIYETVSK